MSMMYDLSIFTLRLFVGLCHCISLVDLPGGADNTAGFRCNPLERSKRPATEVTIVCGIGALATDLAGIVKLA